MRPSCCYQAGIKGKPDLAAVCCPRVCYFRKHLVFTYLFIIFEARTSLDVTAPCHIRFPNSVTSMWGHALTFLSYKSHDQSFANVIGQDVADLTLAFIQKKKRNNSVEF